MPTNGKGRTKRDQLKAWERMSGESHPDLNVPEMPFCLSHLVSVYSDLGEFSYQNIHAYQQVTGCKLAQYEIETLKAIERARNEAPHVTN